MKLEMSPGRLVSEEAERAPPTTGPDPWQYGRYSQRWPLRATAAGAGDSSAPSGGSNSTLSSESSAGAAVAHEPRRSSRERLQDSAAAFLRRVDSLRARRRRRFKADASAAAAAAAAGAAGDSGHRSLGAMKVDGYAISNIEAPLSQERLADKPAGRDGGRHSPAEMSPLGRWIRGGSVRIGRSTTASWRPSSLNMGEESNAYRKKVQAKLKKRKESSASPQPKSCPPTPAPTPAPAPAPVAAPAAPAHAAPLVVYNRSYVAGDPPVEDTIPSGDDGDRDAGTAASPMLAGSGHWRHRSNSCSTGLERDSEGSLASIAGSDQTDSRQRRASVVRWHSFRRESGVGGTSSSPPAAGAATAVSQLTSGQILVLRNHALLRIQSAVQRHCPSRSAAGRSWELPKLMRRRREPDYRARRVFGVPLTVTAQRSGHPLPAVISQALQYLRRTALHQVGLFRKSGVRSRIQKLRAACESAGDEPVPFEDFTAFDVADMVKQYLRELPEQLLTGRVSQMLITIYQSVPAERRAELTRCALLLLPDESRLALQTLLAFLADVAAAAAANQMTAHNLAVCLAPSVLSVTSQRSSSASPRRTRRAGVPAQREVDESRATHECLAHLITQGERLFRLPAALLARCRFSYLDVSRPVGLAALGTEEQPGSWRAYIAACFTALLREARDRPRGWVTVPTVPPGRPDTPSSPASASASSSASATASSSPGTGDVELAYRKVGDGHRLRLWRAAVEVEAPPAEALRRLLRQRHAFDLRLLKWRVVEPLADDAEVFEYTLAAASPLPATEYCVLRSWRTDLPRGACALVETSIEHPDSAAAGGSRRGVVLASRYLAEPAGSGRSKVTHFSRVEQRGLSGEWYNRVYGHECAQDLAALQQSFRHEADGPESRV